MLCVFLRQNHRERLNLACAGAVMHRVATLSY
jgi:hypothetical protein